MKEVFATYKNSETGEMKMSSIWKEVEDEGIVKGKSEVARNLLAQKRSLKSQGCHLMKSGK